MRFHADPASVSMSRPIVAAPASMCGRALRCAAISCRFWITVGCGQASGLLTRRLAAGPEKISEPEPRSTMCGLCRLEAVEVSISWKRLCRCSACSAASLSSHEHRPDDPGEFVGECDRGQTRWPALEQQVDPAGLVARLPPPAAQEVRVAKP